MDANLKPIEENKYNPDNQKTNLFVSQKLDVSEKDKRYGEKQHIQFISFKMPFFKVKYDKKSFPDPNINEGRWTKEERDTFIKGLILYDINWKKINDLIPSRTDTQIRSHAQKFYQRMKSCKDENLGIDFTLKSVKNIRDMINQIKSKCANYDNMFIFKRLLNGCNERKFLKKKKKKNNNRYDNNILKNEEIELDENNNNININFNLNKNDNKNMNIFENNKLNQIINNNCHYNTFEPKNIFEFKNIIDNNIFNNISEPKKNIEFKNIIDNNIFNNNSNTLPNILNDSLNLNSPNDILSNISDNLNSNNNLNDYLGKNLNFESYINYLSLINDLLLTRIKLLNTINSMDNMLLLNSIKQLNFLNSNTLINNNNIFINNNNTFNNNNNSLINNNNPLINNSNIKIDNNIPLIKNEIINNETKENNNNNILIEINEKEK